MNTMLAIVTIQLIYLKLGKKGLTHECVSTPTPASENEVELLVFSSHSLSTNNMIRTARLPPQSYNLL